MNETPERPSNGKNGTPNRFTLDRLAQIRPGGRNGGEDTPASPEEGKRGAIGGSLRRPGIATSEQEESVSPEKRSGETPNPAANLLHRPVVRNVQPDRSTPPGSRPPAPRAATAPTNSVQPGGTRPQPSGVRPASTAAQPGFTRPTPAPVRNQVQNPANGSTPAMTLPPGIQRGFGGPMNERPAVSPPTNRTPVSRSASIPEPVYESIREKGEESTVESGKESERYEVVPPRTTTPPEVEVSPPPLAVDPEPLDQILARLASPPAQTAILGVCEDGLPVLIDLADPTPGALLVISDDELLRRRLLRTLLQSAAALNSPRNVQFIVISSQPSEWRAWLQGQDVNRQCLSVEGLPGAGDEAEGSGSPDRWLIKLAGWADQRRNGTISGPAVILIVDDLEAAARMEYDARVNFDWLVKEGPGVRIWPVVALRTRAAREMTRWVRLFKTRLLGPAEDPALFTQVAADEDLSVASTQFAVQVQSTWLKFRLPVLADEVHAPH